MNPNFTYAIYSSMYSYINSHLCHSTLRLSDCDYPVDRYLHGNYLKIEAERFNRTGNLGRRALFSLAALDAEFVGAGTGGWPVIARRLASDGHIRPEAANCADFLWAFGSLIGNTDMHGGNRIQPPIYAVHRRAGTPPQNSQR